MKGQSGQLHWHQGRHTRRVCLPSLSRCLPRICPLQGRSTKSGPICSVARQPEPAADRGNPRQHSAGGEIDRRFPLAPPVCAQGFLVMLRYIVRIEVAHIGNTILTYAEKGVYYTYKKAYVRKGGGTCQDHANAGAFALCLAAGALGRWMALWCRGGNRLCWR